MTEEPATNEAINWVELKLIDPQTVSILPPSYLPLSVALADQAYTSPADLKTLHCKRVG